MTDKVLITVVIPMRNEEAFIVACVESLLANDAPGPVEILIYDGESSDRSRALVDALAKDHPAIRVFSNPRRIQSAAFNDAVRRAEGAYVVRADAHSVYPRNYISECIRLIESTGAENVGGIQHGVGTSWFSNAIAAALSSRFAAGDARYRYATEPGWVDTVYLGSWRTATLRRLEGMREDWAVNEDYELNVRLRAAGGRVYLSPTIRSTYFVRGSIRSLARQYRRYGFWKVRTLIEHPGSMRARQAIAPLFVLSLIAAGPLTYWFGVIGLLHLAIYALASLTVSASIAARAGWRYLPALPLVFLVIHTCWGGGFLGGLCYWPFVRPKPT